jgi:hypothetical protein
MPSSFGNTPDKIDRYRNFWARGETDRPLTGFTLVGWFPMNDFAASRRWPQDGFLTPEMIDVPSMVADHLRLLEEGDLMDDDLIRGACPANVAIPWLPALLGCRLRVLPQNVLGDERRLSWDEALSITPDTAGPWWAKYTEFLHALVEASAGRFPVSHSAEIGPTDLHAVLRGHTDCLLDYSDEPELSARLLDHLASVFAEFFEHTWRILPRFHGGCFDAQYSLWSPGAIIRMQEDATAVYSRRLCRQFVQPVNRAVAARFEAPFIHLHSTSMFLLEEFLAVEEIRCFEINNDDIGPPIGKMIPFYRRVQQAGRPLLVRGSFTPDQLRLLTGELDPRGLMLLIMVKDMNEAERLRHIAGL